MGIEQQLREGLRREAAGADPWNPDRAGQVRTRVRRADHARRTAGAGVAAAAVLGALVVPAWWATQGGDGQRPVPEVATQSASPSPAPADYRAVLALAGWKAVAMDYSGDDHGEVQYANGARTLVVRWSPDRSYADYHEDRRHITDPPSDGEEVEVLGVASRMWSYSGTDHTSIRPVQAGRWLEVRGSGMGRTEYVELLASLRQVGEAEFEAALPDEFVIDGERADVVAEVLAGIEASTDPLLPPGVDRSAVASDQEDRYQLGADLAGDVACAWLAEYADAQRAGDGARRTAAADALVGSRQWPILLEMNAAGDYPEVVWEYADVVEQGGEPEGFRGALGCD